MSKASQRRLAEQQKRFKKQGVKAISGIADQGLQAMRNLKTGDKAQSAIARGDMWNITHQAAMLPNMMHKDGKALELILFMRPYLDTLAQSVRYPEVVMAPNSGPPAHVHYFTEDWHFVRAMPTALICRPGQTIDEVLESLLKMEMSRGTKPYACAYVFSTPSDDQPLTCAVMMDDGVSASASLIDGKWRVWENVGPATAMLAYAMREELMGGESEMLDTCINAILGSLKLTPSQLSDAQRMDIEECLYTCHVNLANPWVDMVQDMSDQILGMEMTRDVDVDQKVKRSTQRLNEFLEREKKRAATLEKNNQTLSQRMGEVAARTRTVVQPPSPSAAEKRAPLAARLQAVFG